MIKSYEKNISIYKEISDNKSKLTETLSEKLKEKEEALQNATESCEVVEQSSASSSNSKRKRSEECHLPSETARSPAKLRIKDIKTLLRPNDVVIPENTNNVPDDISAIDVEDNSKIINDLGKGS